MIAKERLDLMLPMNRASIEAEDKRLDGLKKSDEERRKMLHDSFESEEKAIAFASARQFRININLDADILATQIMKNVKLGETEWPEIYNESDQQYEVKTIAQLGGPPQDAFLNEDDVYMSKPYFVSSDVVKYPVMSAVTGTLHTSDRVNKRVAYSVAKKINIDTWTLIQSIYGTFPTGTFNQDSSIVSFPTTNAIDASTEGGITVNTMRELLALALRLGIKIDKIYCSPLDLVDIWEWVPVYNAAGSPGGFNEEAPEGVRQDIFTNGLVNNIFGYNITWITDNTLAEGYIYAFGKEPVGYYFNKPSLDKITRYNQKEMKIMIKRSNMEGIEQQKAIKLLIPAYYRKNTIRVKVQ